MSPSIVLASVRSGVVKILWVNTVPENSASLETILQHSTPQWTLIERTTLAFAFEALADGGISVLLCDADLHPHSWRDLLAHLGCLPDAPPLIVTSRLADEWLWAEALNLGAHDVLARPFDPTEVVRSIHSAWLRWNGRRRAA